MSENLSSYDAVKYPIVLQVMNGKIIASQPDLNIYRVRGEFNKMRQPHEIGVVVVDIIQEIARKLKTEQCPPPSLPSKANTVLNPALATKPQRYMKINDAAEAMGVSVSTVTRMCERGELDFKVTPGGHRRLFITDKNLKLMKIQQTHKT